MPSLTIIKLPNIFEKLKCFELRRNPNLEKISDKSYQWIEKLSKGYRKNVHLHRLDYAAAAFYPDADIESLKIVTDYFNLYTLIDDICDDGQEIAKGVVRDMKSIFCGQDDGNLSEIGKATKSFFQHLKTASDSINYDRLCKTVIDIVNSMSEEVKNRDDEIFFTDIESFLKSRVTPVGGTLCINLGLFAHKIEVPKEFCDRDAFKELTSAAINIGIITNDIYSFAREYKKNLHSSNIITVVMKETNCSLQEAFDEAGKIFDTRMLLFEANKRKLLELAGDPSLPRYTLLLETIMVGNLEWMFESGRYYKDSEEVRETHVIEIDF